MLAFLTSNLTATLAAKIASYLAVGTGSGQPQGLFVGASTGVTAADTVNHLFTYDEVVNLVNSIGAQYWPGAVLTASQAAVGQLLKIKGGDGQPIWQPSFRLGIPDSILGFPLTIDPQGPTLAATNKPLVIWAPQHFHVRMCMGGRTAFDVSTQAQFTSWNRVIRTARWLDAKVGDANASKALVLQ
jgi:HK97 family phage major capsid protein